MTVWHRMLYSCTRATRGVKGLMRVVIMGSWSLMRLLGVKTRVHVESPGISALSAAASTKPASGAQCASRALLTTWWNTKRRCVLGKCD